MLAVSQLHKLLTDIIEQTLTIRPKDVTGGEAKGGDGERR